MVSELTLPSNAFHCTFVIVNKQILFVEKDKKFFPTLKIQHMCMKTFSSWSLLFLDPFLMKKVRVDTGAIKFVIGGANVMCPGLTSPGGRLDEDFEEGEMVCILAEGKQHALAIGLAKMSRDQM